MKLSSSFSFSFFFGIVQFPVKLVGKSGEFSLCRRSLLYKLAHLKKSRYTYQSHNEFKSRCLSGQSSLIDYSFPKITELFFFFVFFLLLIFVIIVLRKGRWKEDFIILPNDYKTYRIFNFNNLLSIQLPSFRVRTEKKIPDKTIHSYSSPWGNNIHLSNCSTFTCYSIPSLPPQATFALCMCNYTVIRIYLYRCQVVTNL